MSNSKTRQPSFPPAGGAPLSRAVIKRHDEDFVVEEILPFPLTGYGSHLVLKIQKQGFNSAAVVRWLAEVFNCRNRDIGYCGQKDKRAVTRQHFSIPVSRETDRVLEELDWPAGLRLLSHALHRSKLRRGIHSGNRFTILVREIDAQAKEVDARLDALASIGFPNYFGQQRFGNDGANAERARAWLREGRSRHTRRVAESIQVSALRSLLFNEVLATRIREDTWLKPLPEDAIMLDGTQSFFAALPGDAELAGRIATGDVHVSGPLWGKVKPGMPMGAIEREREWLIAFNDDLALLEARMLMARRPLRAHVRDLDRRWVDARTLQLNFVLTSGSYATALLNELFRID